MHFWEYSTIHVKGGIARMNRIETVQNVEEYKALLSRLRDEGYHDGDITVLTKETDAYDLLSADVDVEQSHTIGAHFKAIFSGAEPSAESLREIGIPEAEFDDYLNVLHYGGAIVYTGEKADLEEQHRASHPQERDGLLGTEIQKNESEQANTRIEDAAQFRRRD